MVKKVIPGQPGGTILLNLHEIWAKKQQGLMCLHFSHCRCVICFTETACREQCNKFRASRQPEALLSIVVQYKLQIFSSSDLVFFTDIDTAEHD